MPRPPRTAEETRAAARPPQSPAAAPSETADPVQSGPPLPHAPALSLSLSPRYGLRTIFIELGCGCDARSIASAASCSPNRCEISCVRSKLPSRYPSNTTRDTWSLNVTEDVYDPISV